MVKDILTPMNHREIEYNAKGLSGINFPDSFNIVELSEVLNWLNETGEKVFDDDLVMDYGTDCLRLYLMFENTPRENDAPFYESWNEGALEGLYKFLGRYRRLILAADEWNKRGNYNRGKISDESIRTMETAIDDTYAKINKYLHRGNTMPNRHNIVSALMELLNTFQRELKIGEIVTALHNHEIETAVPHGELYKKNLESGEKYKNPDVSRLCDKLIGIMSPFAPDMSKVIYYGLN
jgi:hypothetical protein